MTLIEGILLGTALVKLYNIVFTPEQRKVLEDKVKTHHFEYGVATTAAGVITKSPTAIGTGLSLIADDWDDKDKAIQNIKNKISKVLNLIENVQQDSNQIPVVNTFALERLNNRHNVRFGGRRGLSQKSVFYV